MNESRKPTMAKRIAKTVLRASKVSIVRRGALSMLRKGIRMTLPPGKGI